jgi:hypothetical protein
MKYFNNNNNINNKWNEVIVKILKVCTVFTMISECTVELKLVEMFGSPIYLGFDVPKAVIMKRSFF